MVTFLPRWTLPSISCLRVSQIILQPRRILSTQSGQRQRLISAVQQCTDEDFQQVYSVAKELASMTKVLTPEEENMVSKVRTEAEFGSNVKLRPCQPTPHGMGCFAAKDFKKGEVIIPIRGDITEKGDFESIQIDQGRHIHMLQPEVYLNHHCDPNGYIDFETLQYCALRDIKQDEQLFWNFNSTEWTLKRPFQCPCGRDMKGFRFLVIVDQLQLKPFLSPYMQSLLRAKENVIGVG